VEIKMKTDVKLYLAVLLFLLCSCGTHNIDENYAASVVKEALSISGNVMAQQLKGASGAKIFVVATDSKKYVVRVIDNKNQKDRDWEIFTAKMAQEGGYGPQIYFADSNRGIIIMEYLQGKKIIYEDFQSEQFYIALAHLLQKIHQGPVIKGNYNVFDRIGRDLQINEFKCGNNNSISLTKLENIVDVIQKTLLPHLTSVTCHNDLHAGNIIFLGPEFKVIDFEDMGQNDPYFDIATIADETCFFNMPFHEKILLATYLNRQPTIQEMAKLYLMKQLVLIKWCCDALNRLSPEFIAKYELLEVPPIRTYAKDSFEGKINVSGQEKDLMELKMRIIYVLDNFESQEFHDAVSAL
jgi:thiamine kinase-like enzyme